MIARVLIVVVLSALCAGCGGDSGTSVAMTSARRYEPATLSVSVGDTVTWKNESDEAHSVTAYEAQVPAGADYFSSSGYRSESQARDHVEALMTSGETYSVRFDVPGTYEYFCIPHEDQGMKGKIVVEA